jgi:hypothetical protein
MDSPTEIHQLQWVAGNQSSGSQQHEQTPVEEYWVHGGENRVHHQRGRLLRGMFRGKHCGGGGRVCARGEICRCVEAD